MDVIIFISNKEVSLETKEDCVEEFLSVIMEILSFKRFLHIYNIHHNIEVDIDIIRSSCLPVDETRMQYILSAAALLQSSSGNAKPKQNNMTNISKGAEAIPETMISHQYVAQPQAMTTTNVNDVELHSMVSHVKDLLPDCGEGFIITCLRELNYDVEKTINLILENTLPAKLQNLDHNLRKEDIVKSSDVLSTRHSVYDHDDFDIFSKDNVDLSRVQKGKSRFTDNVKSVLDDKNDVETVKELVLNYDEFFNDYEDEYDDTYDTHDVGAQDIDSADELSELTFRRAFTTPLVLRNMADSNDSSDDEEKTSDYQESSSTDKQEKTKAAEAPTHHQDDQRRGYHGNAAGTSNAKRNYQSGNHKERDRSYKDKNKAKIANHNRKAAAAKKHSRGMAS